MDKAERLAAFGRELRRRRELARYGQNVLATRLGISNQHLSQLELSYGKPGRPPVGPGDETIEAISRELGWRVVDMRRMLGQIPDHELEYVLDPDRAFIEEAYDNLPPSGRQALKSTAELLMEQMRAGSVGRRKPEKTDDTEE